MVYRLTTMQHALTSPRPGEPRVSTKYVQANLEGGRSRNLDIHAASRGISVIESPACPEIVLFSLCCYIFSPLGEQGEQDEGLMLRLQVRVATGVVM